MAGVSAGIGVWPPSLEQSLQFLAVGAAENPDQGEIDEHSAADDGCDADQPMAGRALEPARQAGADCVQGDDHRTRGEELPRKSGCEPTLDPEMAAPVEEDVEDRAIEPRAERDR